MWKCCTLREKPVFVPSPPFLRDGVRPLGLPALPSHPPPSWRRPTAPKERRGYLRSKSHSVKQLSFAEHARAERAPGSPEVRAVRSRETAAAAAAADRAAAGRASLDDTRVHDRHRRGIAEQRESCGEKKSGAPDSRFLPSRLAGPQRKSRTARKGREIGTHFLVYSVLRATGGQQLAAASVCCSV